MKSSGEHHHKKRALGNNSYKGSPRRGEEGGEAETATRQRKKKLTRKTLKNKRLKRTYGRKRLLCEGSSFSGAAGKSPRQRKTEGGKGQGRGLGGGEKLSRTGP